MLTEASPIAVGCEVQFADRAPLGLRETTMNRIRTGHTELKGRSEEHTSELQSRQYLVCRLLFDIKNPYNHRLTCRLSLLSPLLYSFSTMPLPPSLASSLSFPIIPVSSSLLLSLLPTFFLSPYFS